MSSTVTKAAATPTLPLTVQKDSETRQSALNSSKQPNGKVKRLHHISRPDNKIEERSWLLGQMAGAFRIFAKLGYADGGSGHISLRGRPPHR